MADQMVEASPGPRRSVWPVVLRAATVVLATVAIVGFVASPDTPPAAPTATPTSGHMAMAPGQMMTPGPMAGAEATGGVPKAAMVHLSELVIEPKEVTVGQGGTLEVMNVGTMAHKLVVDGAALSTKRLNADGAEDLALGALPAGNYKLICAEPGHEHAGMVATLHVVPRNG